MNFKQKHFIDFHKGITPLLIIILLTCFQQWDNLLATIYLALHGTYGLLWITKSQIYPDKQWESKSSIGYGLFIWLGLSLYWISPVVIITEQKFESFNFIQNPSSIYIMMCIIIYILGVFLHFTSDMQKYVYLKLNPGKLITGEMFSKIRNTNYLGELFIYLGFSLLACNYIPLIALLLFIILIWIPNMNKKDKSLSKYSEFNQYKKHTYKVFHFIY